MVRTYTDRPVPRELVDRILDAGRRAPSAGFSQGWAFVVLEGHDQTAPFWALTAPAGRGPGAQWDRLRHASVVIIPLAHRQAYLDRYAEPDKAGLGLDRAESWRVPFWLVDTAFATMAMLLAATDAEVLITPLPATHGITDPDDPRIAERNAVLDRLDAGELTLRQAATEMGVSETWARKLRDDRRAGGADPARLRKAMLERLASDEGRARYAKRKITAEPVFGNIKANLRFRRFSRRSAPAALSEWRLICSVHNLLKLRSARIAPC